MVAVEVTVIRPGVSGNGNRYPAAVLAASAGRWEGATAFVDHPTALDGTRAGGRSVRDIAGVYRGAHWDPARGVRATLHFAPGAEWLARLVEAALTDRAAGLTAPNIGVSADMVVMKRPARDADGTPIWEVGEIRRVNSVDVVFDPAAGGSFDRVVEGRDGWLADGPAREARAVEVVMLAETARTADDGAAARVAEGAGQMTVETLGTGTARAVDAADAGEELRRRLCGELLEARLARTELPEAAARAVRRRLGGRVFEAEELEMEIAEVAGLAAVAARESTVRGHGAVRAAAGGGEAEAAVTVVGGMRTSGDRFQSALDRLFGVTLPDAARDEPRLGGIREAYLLASGGGLGGFPWDRAGLAREANETTTSQLPNLLRNSMTKRLVQDYRAQPRWWEPIVTVAAMADMKTQDRIRLNDFGALATVSENAAYANVQWGDGREQYTPVKKGNTVVVTLEAILNDDTHGVTRIPTKLAAAANVTINEYVANLLTSNPTMSDGFSVYDSLNHGGNAGTSALDAAALQAAISAVMKQTNSAGKRIGARPRFLLVPPDLLWTALTLVNSTLKPGTNNNDVNVLQGALDVVPVPNFTDATDWYLQTDPREVEGVEVGFLHGQREPELLVQDSPTAGAAFTNDAITFKVRWIFGGGWVDYRGAYRSVVAG